MSDTKTDRKQFLTDVLTGAIENGGHGWFSVDEYTWDDPDTEPFAVVIEDDDDAERHRIDFALIRKGLRVIADARPRPIAEGHDAGLLVLHNMTTGGRLYLSHEQRREIVKADRTNGEDGNLDALDYLAIIECGLFGAVTYA